jgi:hypothetical protein
LDVSIRQNNLSFANGATVKNPAADSLEIKESKIELDGNVTNVGTFSNTAGITTGGDLTFSNSRFIRAIHGDTLAVFVPVWKTEADLYVQGATNAIGTVTAYSDIYTDDDTNNTFLGYKTGEDITSGSSNTFIGSEAGLNCTTNSNNAYFGFNSGRGTGSQNTYLGSYTGRTVTSNTGSNNVFLGYKRGTSNTTGNQNIFIGSATTGTYNTTGSNNILIGYNVFNDAATDNSKLKIGNGTLLNIDGDLLTGTTQTLPKYTGENFYVYMASDSLLWAAAKYNATYDIVYKFERCGKNKLFTADSIDLKTNSGKYPLTTVSRASSRNIVRQTTTDYFPCPMAIRTDGVGTTAWVGGNHLDPTATYRTATTEAIQIFVDDLAIMA